MELLQAIQKRVSVRDFADQEVESESLERILEAGRQAPSAKNRQAWRYVVVRNAAMRKELENASFGQEWVGRAPVVIALCTTNIEYKMPNGQLSYPVDLGIASAFMMLQAAEEDLGSCCITTFREQDVKSLLSVPYSMRVVMLLLVGHAATHPEGDQRLSMNRIVAYEHW